MLIQLQIRNFVIIEELDLQFAPGMTVLTGETGAGKSILIDAIGLVLGDKAETSMIRDGEDRSEIVATFTCTQGSAVHAVLEEQAIESSDELILRRVISRDGRSRAFVNSSPVPLQLLKSLGEHLIDIHGQHAHQSLMNRIAQRTLLDAYAAHTDEVAAVNAAWQLWHKAGRGLAEAAGGTDNEAATALLQYQVQELESLNLQADEYVQLDSEFKRLSNASRLQQTAASVMAGLHEEEGSASSVLHAVARDLREMARFDPELGSVIELIDSALIQIDEAVDDLKSRAGRFEADPELLDKTGRRLDQLHDMARKHHVPVEQLGAHLEQLQQRLEALNKARATVINLQKQQTEAQVRYREAAQKLTASRQKAARAMAKEITSHLQGLGMPEGRFLVEVLAGEDGSPQQGGADQIEFLVSMNPGQSPQPMRKVASGGELSRISLAIQIVSRDEQGAPTLIFDEVDAGIGGGTAEIVGKLLQNLADHHQIFCVTHLAQVAAQGHQHFQVGKRSVGGKTIVEVTALRGPARVDEISRMLGGVKISDKTRAHAKEMLAELAKG